MKTLNLSKAKANLSEIVANAERRKEKVVIEKRNKPVAVVISYDDYKRLEAIEEGLIRADEHANRVLKCMETVFKTLNREHLHELPHVHLGSPLKIAQRSTSWSMPSTASPLKRLRWWRGTWLR